MTLTSLTAGAGCAGSPFRLPRRYLCVEWPETTTFQEPNSQEFCNPLTEHIREMDDQFHALICKLSGRSVISDTLLPLHRKTQRYRKASIEDKERMVQVVKEHRRIYDAIAAGNADLAEHLTTEHIAHAKESMLKRVKHNR